MIVGTVYHVPHGPGADFVRRVNHRAGRKILTLGLHGTGIAAGQRPLKPGQIVLVMDGNGSTQPTTYRVLDRLDTVL